MTSSYNWRGVPIPAGLAARPKSAQGYPIPYVAFVAPDGTPDFRVLDVPKQVECIKTRKCGLCGRPLGFWAAFLGGLLVELNRISTDPGMCEDCAIYAAQVCPYLARDNARYSQRALPESTVSDKANAYEAQAVMFVLYANTWTIMPNPDTPGVVYAHVPRWHPTKTRYFVNGVELTKDEAFQVMRDNPPDAETIYALEMARKEHSDDRLRMRLGLTLAELHAGKIYRP
jgi:hypothetical protein